MYLTLISTTEQTFNSQFEVGRQLGYGNFASVHKAREKKSGVFYAVKIVERRKDFNLKFTQSLEREIGTLMSIDHVSHANPLNQVRPQCNPTFNRATPFSLAESHQDPQGVRRQVFLLHSDRVVRERTQRGVRCSGLGTLSCGPDLISLHGLLTCTPELVVANCSIVSRTCASFRSHRLDMSSNNSSMASSICTTMELSIAI